MDTALTPVYSAYEGLRHRCTSRKWIENQYCKVSWNPSVLHFPPNNMNSNDCIRHSNWHIFSSELGVSCEKWLLRGTLGMLIIIFLVWRARTMPINRDGKPVLLLLFSTFSQTTEAIWSDKQVTLVNGRTKIQNLSYGEIGSQSRFRG